MGRPVTENRCPTRPAVTRPCRVQSVEWLESPTLADLAPVAEMLNRWQARVVPGERPAPAEELEAGVNRAPSHRFIRIAVAKDGGRVIGAAGVVMEDLEGRQNDAYVDFVVVEPEARRHGVGTALLDAAVDLARRHGRKRLSGESLAGDEAGEAFARHHGAEPELLEQQNRALTAGIDRDLLRGWVRRAAESASDYSLVRIDGSCPDDLLAAFARLNAVMNTAPSGPNLQDLVLSPDDVAESQRAFEEQGYTRWTVIVRHAPSGDLAGYTELMLSPFRPWLAFQWDTGVDPLHRNLGLGRWMKAANALRLIEERPQVEQIETWNAGSNAAMLTINRAMGFRTVAEWQIWETPI